MAKIKAPVYSLMAHGWLNKYFYQRTGVVKNPYPIGLFGRNLLNPIYYSIKGWNYEMRRTWHGIQAVAKHGTLPPDPSSPEQLGNWDKFSEAIQTWQLMSQPQKEIYNKLKYPEHTSGYNKFISWYLRSKPTMPVYWGTLQRSADDSRTVEQKMVDQDLPTIRYPFNFRQYQLFNMVLHQGMGFPDSPVEGQLFYNSSDDNIYVFKNGSWSEVGGGGPGTDTRIATVIVAFDGSGDYTDIQDGIDALPAGGGLVFIKNGTYNIDAQIVIAKSNVTLQGQGPATIIHLNNGVNLDAVYVGNNTDPFSNIFLRDFKVEGNGTNNPYTSCIDISDYCSRVTIMNVWCYDGAGDGIVIGWDCDYCNVFGCTFENNGYVGVYCYGADFVSIQGNKFFNNGISYGAAIENDSGDEFNFSNNTIVNNVGINSGYGIMLFGYYSNGRKGIIQGNTIQGTYIGIGLFTYYGTADRITVIGNYIKDTYEDGIASRANHSIISGNIIEGPDGNGITIEAQYNVVTANEISTVGQSGIECSSDNTVIQGNVIDAVQLYGIILKWASNCLITGNQIYDCSLATDGLYSGIWWNGDSGYVSKNNSVYDNVIIGPTAGNKKGYSIKEYGAYVDYNMIRGNRCKNAKFIEILVSGQNSEAFDNTITSN